MSQNRSLDIPPNCGGLVIEPNNNDVLSGRGGRINAHPGNKQYREIVRRYRGIYHSNRTRKLDKAKIAAKIIEIVRSMDPPGRFLKEESNAWVEIGDVKARKKAGQAMREKEPSRSRSQDDESVMSNNEHTFSGTGAINMPTIQTAQTAASTTSTTSGSVNQQMMEQMRHYGLSQSPNYGTHTDYSDSPASHNTSDRSRGMRETFQRSMSLNSTSLWDEPQTSQSQFSNKSSFNESTTSIDSSRRRQFRMMKNEESFSQLQIPKSLPKSEEQGQLDEGELMNQSLVSMEMQSIEMSAVFMSINDMIMSSLNEVVADTFDSDTEEAAKDSLSSAEKKKSILSSGDNSNTTNFDQQNENLNNAKSSDFGVW